MDFAEIAVILTIYNEEIAWVRQSIASILGQTYSKLKLYILLDNPDNKEAIKYIAKLQEKDPRVLFWINPQNIGLVASLNKLITYVSEEYTARMDADDISVPERLEKEFSFLQSNNLDFVMSGIDYIYEDGRIGAGENIPELLAENFAEAEKYCNLSNHPTWLLKTDLYHKLKGYRDVKYCEDFDFVLRAIQAGYRLGRLEDALLHYRLRDSGVSKSYALEQFEKANYLRRVYEKSVLLETLSAEDINHAFSSFSGKEKMKFIQAKKDMDCFCDALYSHKWVDCIFLACQGWFSGKAYRRIFVNGIHTRIKLHKVYKSGAGDE